jgi:O-antigen/teichoic acid export membrane protein
MSLKNNIAANYASQIYVTLIGIFMLPFYLRHMGAEAYGLVGFFALLQSWFSLLDMGLSATMTRETARYQGGVVSAVALRQLFRALEVIFIVVAVSGALILALASDLISNHWLNVKEIPYSEVSYAIKVMAVIVALRWVSGLFRGVINGFERQVLLGAFNAVVASFRFILVIPVFIFIGASPKTFFLFQLIIAILELFSLVLIVYRILPKIENQFPLKWDWQSLLPVLKFALSISFLSIVWILVTQTDKLLLSKILPLSDYGYFTLATMAAGGILLLSGPISSAILPRFTRLYAEGKQIEFFNLYRKSTQYIAILVFSAALVLAVFAEKILWIWTGNQDLALKASSALSLYALGNAILAVAAFPYFLQFANGNMRLHIYGNILFLIFLIPSVIWATVNHGITGAGWAWLLANAIYLICWIPIVHRRFAKGMHMQWLFRDIGLPLSISLILTLFFFKWIPVNGSKIHQGMVIGGLGVIVLTTNLLTLKNIREQLMLLVSNRRL